MAKIYFLYSSSSPSRCPGTHQRETSLHVGGVGHVHDHQRIAKRALMIFHAQLIVPAAIEIRVLPAVVKVMMRAVALFSGIEFLKQTGFAGSVMS